MPRPLESQPNPTSHHSVPGQFRADTLPQIVSGAYHPPSVTQYNPLSEDGDKAGQTYRITETGSAMTEVDIRSMPSRGGEGSSGQRSASQDGEQINGQAGDSYNHEGRTTPTPESESANHLSRTSSLLSTAEPANSSMAMPNPNSNPGDPVGGAQPPQSHRAEVGFGPLSGEEQLKSSLLGKDRIFLLVLAKEIEAFIEKIALGQEPNIIPSIPLATNSTSVLASMSASFAIASHISSTFQRMLVYKLAEWYGLKAVNTPEVSMLVGVIGTMNPHSRNLKLSDLAPRADTPPQKFRIMQRTQPNSSTSSNVNGLSRASSVSADDAGSEASSSRVRTLEEREAAYNKARERIYGSTDGPEESQEAMVAATATIRGTRAVQNEADDFETAPRAPPAVAEPTFQPVYPSLFDPPKQTTNGTAGPSGSTYDPSTTSYQRDTMRQHYPQQAQAQPQQQVQMQMQMPQYMNNYQSQPGYQTDYSHGPQQQQYGMPPYMPQGNPYGVSQHPNNGYPNQWGQTQHQQAYGRQQMPPSQIPQGWMQPNHGQGQGQAPMPMSMTMAMSNQPMPMIPQGMQYPGVYGHPPQQQGYPPLMQPTPTRPAVHPHSSASSSISSRSYQSYHDGSRPHSRGSTTSNLSATSSVRFGAMYPANQGGGYRQKGLKGPVINGMNGIAGLGTPSEKRSTRAHSPSSTTTTSSRSSRQTGSISLVPPSQHPLPQRPDWAANNVPYQIAPINRNGPTDQNGSPSTNDFPPLARGGNTGTYAEPMQVERAKTRPSGSSAWNGIGPKPIGPLGQPQSVGQSGTSTSGHEVPPTSPRTSMLRTPGPLVPSPKTPIATSTLSPISPGFSTAEETDFPRRVPSINSSQTLFDPSVNAAPTPASISTPISGSANAVSRPGSTLPSSNSLDESSMSPEEIIEAKLAAISLREGVIIGPPPNKENGNGAPNGSANGNGHAPSYARIVKRD